MNGEETTLKTAMGDTFRYSGDPPYCLTDLESTANRWLKHRGKKVKVNYFENLPADPDFEHLLVAHIDETGEKVGIETIFDKVARLQNGASSIVLRYKQIGQLVIDQQYEGNGLGRRMIVHVVSTTREEGILTPYFLRTSVEGLDFFYGEVGEQLLRMYGMNFACFSSADSSFSVFGYGLDDRTFPYFNQLAEMIASESKTLVDIEQS